MPRDRRVLKSIGLILLGTLAVMLAPAIFILLAIAILRHFT